MSPERLGWQSGHVSDQPAPYVPLRRRRSWRSSIAHRSLDAVECGVEVGPASSARLIGGLVRDYSTAIPNRGLTALAYASSGRRLVIFEVCLTVLAVASSTSGPRGAIDCWQASSDPPTAVTNPPISAPMPEEHFRASLEGTNSPPQR